MRDRMAGPENGLFFPIRPNKMIWRMKGGDKPDVSPLFSVENGRCIRLPLPGTSDTQRLIYVTIRSTARSFTDNDCTHRMRDRALPSGGWGATPRRISESAPYGPATGSQHIGARRTHLFTRFHIHLVTLTLTAAMDKICGLKPLSTIYTVVNAEGRLVL